LDSSLDSDFCLDSDSRAPHPYHELDLRPPAKSSGKKDSQNCVIVLQPLAAKQITFSFGFQGKKQQNTYL
jgi:hypothetical protein